MTTRCAAAASHLRKNIITDKSHTTSMDPAHGPMHDSWTDRYRRKRKLSSMDKCRPLTRGFSRSLIW